MRAAPSYSTIRAASVDVVHNHLLGALSVEAFDQIAPFLEWVELKKGVIFQDANRRADFVYFVEAGVVSLLASTATDDPIELALVGRTGLVGTGSVLGSSISLQRACVPIGGTALRIAAVELTDLLHRNVMIRDRVFRYVRAQIVQQSHTALCNAKHAAEAKVARWLLLARDHLDSDTITVTHDLLSVLVNARRASVTEALGRFESDGILVRGRGELLLRNREALSARACSCYRTIRDKLFESAAARQVRSPA
jgi:CRP-like cAMP-binding protein